MLLSQPNLPMCTFEGCESRQESIHGMAARSKAFSDFHFDFISNFRTFGAPLHRRAQLIFSCATCELWSTLAVAPASRLPALRPPLQYYPSPVRPLKARRAVLVCGTPHPHPSAQPTTPGTRYLPHHHSRLSTPPATIFDERPTLY